MDECARITKRLVELPSGGAPWFGWEPRRTCEPCEWRNLSLTQEFAWLCKAIPGLSTAAARLVSWRSGSSASQPLAEIFVSLVFLSVNRLLRWCKPWLQSSWCSVLLLFRKKEKKNHLWKASTPFPSRHASPSGTVSSQPVPHTMGQRCVNLAAPKHTQARCQELDYLREFSAQRQRRHTSLISATFSRERVGLWPMTRDRCSQLIEGDAASAGTATRPG